jgi:hypothetical protein
MTTNKNMCAVMPLIAMGFVALAAVGGLVVRELWNWLAPELIDARPITYWEAVGLLVLCRLLFGGWSSRRAWSDKPYAPRESFPTV